MATASYRNKHKRQKRKKPGAKRQRIKVQRRRLIDLGLPAEEVEKMDPKTVREKLRRPALIKKETEK